MIAQQGDQQRPVAAADIDDLAEGGPVVGGRDRWRLGGQLAAHQRVVGRGPVRMLGEVLPEPAPEVAGIGRLTGANRVQQLHQAQVGMPYRALQVDRRPNAVGVIVAQPLARVGQRVGAVLVASQKSSGDEVIQHAHERIGRYSKTGSELWARGHFRSDRVRDP